MASFQHYGADQDQPANSSIRLCLEDDASKANLELSLDLAVDSNCNESWGFLALGTLRDPWIDCAWVRVVAGAKSLFVVVEVDVVAAAAELAAAFAVVVAAADDVAAVIVVAADTAVFDVAAGQSTSSDDPAQHFLMMYCNAHAVVALIPNSFAAAYFAPDLTIAGAQSDFGVAEHFVSLWDL